MRSFRQRSFLSLLALHDVIDDDWLVHAVSFIFPYFCVYFHLFAQAKRLGRRRLLLLLLLFSFLRVSRRRRRRCYPPPRFREEELIHQSSSSSSSSSRGRGSGREKSSRRSTHRALLLLKCALFLTSAFQSIEYFSFFSLSPQKKTRMSKRSFLGDGTTLSSSSSLIISAAASAASVHPLYQKLLSSLLTTKTQQNHHRHNFCRRSWYSSESNKEELEKEIGYYTGKKRNPLTDTRLHQYDRRPPPNALCEICSRRFCSCEENRTMKRKPEMPGPEDCCQSSPQCKFCVWTIYDEQLAEYETNKELYMDKLK